MKRRICVALALMIALMLSVCAVADEYENAVPTQDVEEETPVISAGNVDDEVGEAKEADLDDLPEKEPEEELTEEEKTPEQPVIEEESEEEESEEEKLTVVEEPAEEETIKEEPAEGEPTEEEPTKEEPADKGSIPEGVAPDEQPAEEEPAEEEASEAAVEAEPVEEQPEVKAPVANALTYTGEAQALISAQGAWLYSLDGENYGEDIPTAVDAGDYTVYFKADMDAEPETLTVTVAKADVTFTPPVAAFIED